jgi:RNA ligase (TIGR02306 family)
MVVIIRNSVYTIKAPRYNFRCCISIEKDVWFMRKLATVKRISDIQPIHNSETLSVATVDGWKSVIRTVDFQIGDLCVYFEIDSILPQLPEFEFLAPSYRLKTMRMRGQLSEGLCWFLHILPTDLSIVEGMDVTEILRVEKYEVQIPDNMIGASKGYHPKAVRKTGEFRAQSEPTLLAEFQGLRVARTQKVEGYSASYIEHNGEVDVCSHTHSLLEDKACLQWQMAYKYDLINVLKSCKNIGIQGEIAGDGIFGNPMGLPDKQLFIFRITNTDTGVRYTPQQIITFCETHGLQHVHMDLDIEFNFTMEEVLAQSKGTYALSGYPQEGVVFVPMEPVASEFLRDWLSMKVINAEYLLGEWKKKRKGK